jgi:Transposase DDE domain
MNKDKIREPFHYPNTFLLLLGYAKVYFHLLYRQTEGIIKATGKNLPDHPCYSQISRRVNKLDIVSNMKSMDNYNDDVVIIAAG